MEIANFILLVATLIVSCVAVALTWKGIKLQREANDVAQSGLKNQNLEIQKSESADVEVREVMPATWRGRPFFWPKYVDVGLINTGRRIATNVTVLLELSDPERKYDSRPVELRPEQDHKFRFEPRIHSNKERVQIKLTVNYRDTSSKTLVQEYWLLNAKDSERIIARDLITPKEGITT